nr:hypothetical protein [Mucilaginibacter sp. E4BP6]
MPWSVCPETVGQLAPKWCGLIHHNLQIKHRGLYHKLKKNPKIEVKAQAFLAKHEGLKVKDEILLYMFPELKQYN